MLGYLARYAAASVVSSVAVNEAHRFIDRRRQGPVMLVDDRPVEPVPVDAAGQAVPVWARRVFGIPGASLRTATFSLDVPVEAQEMALEAGIAGERVVAQKLARLAEQYPNTYVFNSVKLPGNTGDVDHVVVQGNTMLLVDSKNWKHGAAYNVYYSTPEADFVTRDGMPFEGGEIHTQAQTREWAHAFAPGGMNVRALLVVANDSSTVSETIGSPYWITNLSGIEMAFEGTFTRDETPVMPLELLTFMVSLVQSRMPAVDAELAALQPAPKPKVTTFTKWLVAWSCINYAFIWILLPVAIISAVPLLALTHVHRSKVKKAALPGAGLLTTVLVFTYLLVVLWITFLVSTFSGLAAFA